MKVLVIDDQEDVRYIARLSLCRMGGMTVIEAKSGEEGVRLAREERPDAILLDLMMPGMDGPATLRALRGDVRTESIPIVFLTAAVRPADVQGLKDLGARGVILKPFDPTRLASQVCAILEA